MLNGQARQTNDIKALNGQAQWTNDIENIIQSNRTDSNAYCMWASP